MQFKVSASDYWDNHYVFDKISAKKTKTLGEDAINNLIISTICPVMFVYGKQNLKPELCERAIDFFMETPPESNSIIKKWNEFGIKARNSAESQSLLELKKYYCTSRKCLNCAIGNFLLKGNSS